MGNNPFSTAQHSAWITSSRRIGFSCDLKHNFAVWQRYALNDLHFPIDCVLNAYCGHPQNYEFLSNNRKVAAP
jgi:hypothetical protein